MQNESTAPIIDCGSSATATKGGRSGIKTSAKHHQNPKPKMVNGILKARTSDEGAAAATRNLLTAFEERDTKTQREH